MRLRAEIVIDMEAADFNEAADHQRRIDEVLEAVRTFYDGARLEFRQRRERSPRQHPARSEKRYVSGRMASYTE